MKQAHSVSLDELISDLTTSVDDGLTIAESRERLKRVGPNIIKNQNDTPWWKLLIDQLKSPIVYLLLFAATMSFYFSEWLDGVAILVVILIKAAVPFNKYDFNTRLD